MILEIDAGNSRIKWRILADEHARAVAEGNLLTPGNSALVSEELEKLIADIDQNLKSLQRVKVSSVRGERFESEFIELLKGKYDQKPEFARVKKSCGGVSNSYSDVSTMGVDRWLALLAAYKKTSHACCVLDFGSAITFDSIDSQGVHQGGYIVPGLHLMQESLARKTPALNIAFENWKSITPGFNTGDAISSGIAAMAAGFAEHCYQQFNNSIAHQDKSEPSGAGAGAKEVRCLLTGGDAALMSDYLSLPHRVEKDLVLDGLSIALP